MWTTMYLLFIVYYRCTGIQSNFIGVSSWEYPTSAYWSVCLSVHLSIPPSVTWQSLSQLFNESVTELVDQSSSVSQSVCWNLVRPNLKTPQEYCNNYCGFFLSKQIRTKNGIEITTGLNLSIVAYMQILQCIWNVCFSHQLEWRPAKMLLCSLKLLFSSNMWNAKCAFFVPT